MQLKFPINLIDIDSEASTGDVVTRDGEYLGVWALTQDPDRHPDDFGARLRFIPDGQTEYLFEEIIASQESGVSNGLATSRLCRAIREWHEETNAASSL
jgi:hypothetical protein